MTADRSDPGAAAGSQRDAELAASLLRPTPAYQPGRTSYGATLVLAAPGLDEEAAGHPAAGRTGTHLDAILSFASRAAPDSFPSSDRRDYRIVNAVALILHGKRPLPTKTQIRAPENLARLRHQLGDSRLIAAFGPHAISAVREIGLEPDFCTGHPGLKGVNQLPVRVGTELARATSARLRFLSKVLLRSCGRCDEAMAELVELRKAESVRRKRLKNPEAG